MQGLRHVTGDSQQSLPTRPVSARSFTLALLHYQSMTLDLRDTSHSRVRAADGCFLRNSSTTCQRSSDLPPDSRGRLMEQVPYRDPQRYPAIDLRRHSRAGLSSSTRRQDGAETSSKKFDGTVGSDFFAPASIDRGQWQGRLTG